jgi:hypothetical protein
MAIALWLAHIFVCSPKPPLTVDWNVRTARPLVKPPLFKAPRLLTEGVIAVSRWNEAVRDIILLILIDLVNSVENER